MIEPIPDVPAAIADCGDERVLALADFHAGIEVALRYDGVEVASRADQRRETVLELLAETDADRLVVIGDIANGIGEPAGAERRELERFLDAVTRRVPVTVVKGNHDGAVEAVAGDLDADHQPVTVTATAGVRLGPVGFVHGHTWPAPRVLGATVVGMGHEHPMVRLTDEVGGTRVERAWLRGRLTPGPFREREPDAAALPTAWPDLVVFPAFNELLGGTWVNESDRDFLSPFLPEGLVDGEAYLLDGTRLGAYDRI